MLLPVRGVGPTTCKRLGSPSKFYRIKDTNMELGSLRHTSYPHSPASIISESPVPRPHEIAPYKNPGYNARLMPALGMFHSGDENSSAYVAQQERREMTNELM